MNILLQVNSDSFAHELVIADDQRDLFMNILLQMNREILVHHFRFVL